MTLGETEILSWETGKARVAGFTTTGRKGATTLKIELVVTDPWELGDLVRRLAELRDQPVRKANTDV